MRANLAVTGAALAIITAAIAFVLPASAGDSGPLVRDSMSVQAETDPYPPVVFYDLSGPRVGITMAPDGSSRSQFGWHGEHQVLPAVRGQAFLLQSVVLVGGFERREFVPNVTFIFGTRMPGGFEFGLGPSATFGRYGMRTSVVLAAGHSFEVGGIRVPLDVALAADRDGQRLTVATGWAVREVVVGGR